MRHFRIFRPSFGLMLRMLAGVAVCAVSSSCTDDTFDKHGHQGASGMLAFDGAAPGSWADGSAATRVADKDISIRKLTQSEGGKPLYLVTEIAEAAVDTAASNAITRGTTTTGETFKNHSFGLSATCYTGDWPGEEETNKWTTNFAHNIKVSYTESDSKWKSEKSLYWVGSENIKFFAYSPYSAAAPASSEEDAADADDATPSVIHSAADATGIPTLTYTVPTDVTKQIDLMYATADCGGNGTGDVRNGAVQLNFKHALTAVTIKTGEKMLAGKVTKIEISGVHGSGSYPIGATNWTITDETAGRTFSIDNETALDGNKDKNEIMTKPGTILNGDDKGYTFMMIPQELTDDAKLTISFTDKLTNTERTLTAKLKEFTKNGIWEIGKQYTYSINSTGIVITPVIEWSIDRENTLLPDGGQTNTPIPGEKLYTELNVSEIADSTLSYLPVSGFLRNVKINSYAKVTQVGHETKTVLLPFKMEYLIGEETTWQTAYDSNTSEKKSEYEGSIKLPAQAAFDELQKPFKSSLNTVAEGETEAVNLADEGSVTGVHESANCYIVNKPGYYKFPTYYGNMWPSPKTTAYKYEGEVLNEGYNGGNKDMKDYVLGTFVDHNNKSIPSDGRIPDIHDAVPIWQDSPELVVDVQYDSGFVYFRVLKETLTQGNAVIAVRDMSGTILWSWHIWATHYDWQNGIEAVGIVQDQSGRNFRFAPCNLGYCDSQDGSPKRRVQIRFTSILSDGLEQVVTTFGETTFKGVPAPINGIFTLYQPQMIESVAGDNTYYQWGRKDPMLPGVYNSDTRANKGVDFDGFGSDKDKKEQFDMVNKTFYSTPQYRFASSDCGRSIGESIQLPYEFFMHPNPNKETDSHPDNYKRRHWHDGSGTGIYDRKAVMNYWNSQLDSKGEEGSTTLPNNLYVYKTIYDPSPAGYKVPPPAAFAVFFKEKVTNTYQPKEDFNGYKENKKNEFITSWTLKDQKGTSFEFPATGLRDMGLLGKPTREISYGSWPAHSKLTFIISSGFLPQQTQGTGILFSLDLRDKAKMNNQEFRAIHGTNNSYGFTVRPIRDGQKN